MELRDLLWTAGAFGIMPSVFSLGALTQSLFPNCFLNSPREQKNCATPVSHHTWWFPVDASCWLWGRGGVGWETGLGIVEGPVKSFQWYSLQSTQCELSLLLSSTWWPSRLLPASPPNLRSNGRHSLAASEACKKRYLFPRKLCSGHPPLACMYYYHTLISIFVVSCNSSRPIVFAAFAEMSTSKLVMWWRNMSTCLPYLLILIPSH